MKSKQFMYLLAAFLLGGVWFVSLRAVSIKDTSTHYHANMNVYVNGVREPFDSFTQYEEVQSCTGAATDNPRTRAHLHKPNNDVVHVHDTATTWGAFFANVGYGVTNQAITTPTGTFVNDVEGKKLTFILNGDKVDTIANRVIGDKDALLVSYGNQDDKSLQQQYDGIRKNAEQINTQLDPATCSGTKPLTFWDRITKAIDPTH